MDISFRCNKCGQNIVIDAASAGQLVDCPKCRTPLEVPYKSKSLDKRVISPAKMRERYIALRWISASLKVAAVLCIVVGIAGGVACVVGGELSRYGTSADNTEHAVVSLMALVGCLLVGGLCALLLWAAGDLIMVFIDIEENTRALRELMETPLSTT
jgi:DNA-directed RNA polymerase subunit RPC12/RpoP